ncbi:MAG: hypothetical protein ACJ741_04390 [Pyrinomonadaceae bacterium]
MSDDSDVLAAPLPPDAEPQASESNAAGANDADFIARRVRLPETLIEEYETHAPFDESDNTSVESELAAMVEGLYAPDLKNVTQPTLKKKEVEALGAGGGEMSADECDAERTAGFFTLMAKAQQEEARKLKNLLPAYRLRIKAIFDREFLEGWDDAPEGEELDQLAETLAAHEIHGFIDDLREEHRQATAHIKDEEARGAEIERRALESWLVSYRAAADAGGRGSRTDRARTGRWARGGEAASMAVEEALTHDTAAAAEDEPLTATSSADEEDDDLVR